MVLNAIYFNFFLVFFFMEHIGKISLKTTNGFETILFGGALLEGADNFVRSQNLFYVHDIPRKRNVSLILKAK